MSERNPLTDATSAFLRALERASPAELRDTLRAVDDVVCDMGQPASRRRLAGKIRTLLRYEVKRS